METVEVPQISELEELGFTAASKQVKDKRELARKMRIAFEHFSVVTQEQIAKFNSDLYQRTHKKTYEYNYTYQTLKFTPIDQYTEVPPAPVLAKLKEAKAKDCFDSFCIATIVDVNYAKVPDPILFGMIKGCTDHFYIAQWDNDVRIEDILKPEEIING